MSPVISSLHLLTFLRLFAYVCCILARDLIAQSLVFIGFFLGLQAISFDI